MAITDKLTPAVYTRAAWTDAWTARPYLIPVSWRLCLQPQLPSATLAWRYGLRKEHDETAFTATTPPDLRRHFVKIVTTGLPTWYGIIEDMNYTPILGQADPSGDVTYAAFGLEHLLDRIIVDSALAYDPNDSAPGAPSILYWAPPFNARHERGGTLLGNMAKPIYGGVVKAVFGKPDDGDPLVWTHKDIIDYLVNFYMPSALTWAVAAGDAYSDQAHFESVIDYDGMRLRELLNRVIRRDRGFAWRLAVSGDESEIQLAIVSALHADITYGAVTLHENASQSAWNLAAAAANIESLELKDNSSTRYDRCVAIGSRVITCFSLWASQGDLEAGWPADLEAAYKAAAGPGGGRTWSEQLAANDHYRADDRFRAVFALYRAPRNWDFISLADGGAEQYCDPYYEDGVLYPEVDASALRSFRRFLPWLPLLEGVDYSNIHFPDQLPAATEQAFRKPFALVKDHDGRYRYAHDLQGQDEAAANARVAVGDRDLSIEVRFSPAYLLAKNHWDSTAVAGLWMPVYDYDELIVTVAAEGDARMYVLATRAGHTPTSADRLMRVFVPEAECWYVANETVVGVNTAGAVRQVNTIKPKRVLRDDAAILKAIANIAIGWYGAERTAADMTWNRLAAPTTLGTLVTTLDMEGGLSLNGNCVVSEITWNYLDQRTQIVTDWWEIDARGMVFGTGAARDLSRELRGVRATTLGLQHEEPA